MKISIVLPAHNEEENLGELLPEIYQVLGENVEIIVIDDASCDNTNSIARACGAKVIKNSYNMGNGASIKRGIRQASGEVVVLMDGDGQHSPRELPKLLKELDSFDMIIGARIGSHQAWWRKLANNIYNMLATYVSGVKIKDLTSGFRAMKKDKAMKFLYLLPNTFSYPSTLTLAFIKAAYAVKFVPVKVLPRRGGKSKINLVNDGFRFLLIIMKIAVFFSPLRVFLPVSIFFFLCGFIYYGYTFFCFHRFTNMSALLLTTSVTIFILGLISEQISSLKMEKIDE
ncbi:MAG: glycosyltransferase family 2 protein [Candidatus Omnitrophica bacterium]|nr:glycosyltransferase family 2 protein [Candidatus Omnitrophota bacterium]